MQSECRVHLSDVPGQGTAWGPLPGERFKVIVETATKKKNVSSLRISLTGTIT